MRSSTSIMVNPQDERVITDHEEGIIRKTTPWKGKPGHMGLEVAADRTEEE
ncbi:hypothetical protein F2Q70_00033296 [Brassica cretica]|uniref:Uncharacterized protein n=1 Tax=Brassica cretica TaxID=69181 RepID=A0A8S9FH09_BRACR|nr:hypothetical protein F2Q70_00033296 [Brassica cretica]